MLIGVTWFVPSTDDGLVHSGSPSARSTPRASAAPRMAHRSSWSAIEMNAPLTEPAVAAITDVLPPPPAAVRAGVDEGGLLHRAPGAVDGSGERLASLQPCHEGEELVGRARLE